MMCLSGPPKLIWVQVRQCQMLVCAQAKLLLTLKANWTLGHATGQSVLCWIIFHVWSMLRTVYSTCKIEHIAIHFSACLLLCLSVTHPVSLLHFHSCDSIPVISMATYLSQQRGTVDQFFLGVVFISSIGIARINLPMWKFAILLVGDQNHKLCKKDWNIETVEHVHSKM